MKPLSLLFALAVAIQSSLMAQTYTVSGYVTEPHTNEKLIGATVASAASGTHAVTNNFGFFSLKLAAGAVKLSTSYVGFQPSILTFTLRGDTVVTLQPGQDVTLDTLTVSATRKPVTEVPVSKFELSVQEIKKIPALLGETDVFKAVQLMPGIQAGMEGSAGTFVRGGDQGDNLILIDGIPVYNPNHLYGFFSVFNTDAVKNVTVYKGAFPARYNGSSSSVIDVRMKEGSSKDFSVDGSIGLISSKLKVEGPIIPNRTSFLVSGRRTYIDALTPTLKKMKYLKSNFPAYYFYDINAKVTHKVSNRSNVYFSFYNGYDHIVDNTQSESYGTTTRSYQRKTRETSGWGNTTGRLRWNQRIGSSLFANLTLASSVYKYFVDNRFTSTTTKDTAIYHAFYNLHYQSQIQSNIARVDFDYYPGRQTIRFGVSANQRNLVTGKSHYQYSDEAYHSKSDTLYQLPEVDVLELMAYAEDEFKVRNATVNMGVSISGCKVGNKLYTSPEPRLSINLPVNERIALKAGVSRMAQYLQLINKYKIQMATDAWVSADETRHPMLASQIDAGVSWQINATYSVSVEGYYKKLDHVLGLQAGESLYLATESLDNMLEEGKGTAKGIELQCNKSLGKLTGWVNYTLSKAERTYPTINHGHTFPFKYDRRHAINVVVNYAFTKNLSANATWIFGSGYPQTLPTAQYNEQLPIWDADGDGYYFIEYYPSVNNHRLPSYRRLDVGVSYQRQHKRYKSSWNVGAFNALNRNNPVYQYYTYAADYSKRVLCTKGLLQFIPYITYTFSF